jgi:hypothetical protein
LLIDPSYLAFCEVADKVANRYAMGKLLLGITKVVNDTGCSVQIVNHNNKNRPHQALYDAPDLGDVSYAGFAEWARFWTLLGARQEWSEADGRHWLWLRTGGSAGFAALHHLNVLEGKPDDKGNRIWQVEVLPATEGNKRAEEGREAARDAKAKEKQERAIEKVVQAMTKYRNGETKTVIKETSGLRHAEFSAALAELLLRGDAELCEVIKGNHKTPKDGYRLCDRE